MAVKYTFSHTNVNNDIFECDISNVDFIGDATEISGNCSLDYAEVESPFTPIRGCGLIIELDADITQTFEDLAESNEREYKVEWYQVIDAVRHIKFIGFISPEGIFEDWVNDKWLLTINAIGGLGYLENLKYVDEFGLPFLGKQSPMQIISNCLKRTGLELNINSRIDFEYVGFDNEDVVPLDRNILIYTALTTDRYYREDEETIMDCQEVLESVLSIFNASICQMDGQWWIYNVPSLMAQGGVSTKRFLRHNFEGETIEDEPFNVLPIWTRIGSHIQNAPIFHCNENQRKERKSALASFKVNYKYGLVSSIFINEELNITPDWIPGTNTIVEGWTVFNSTPAPYKIFPSQASEVITVSGPPFRLYLRLSSYDAQVGSGETPALLLRSDEIPVVAATVLTVDIGMLHNPYINATVIKVFFKDLAANVFYFDLENGWMPWIPFNPSPSPAEFIYLGGTVDEGGYYGQVYNNFELILPPMPEDGFTFVEFWQPRDYWDFENYVWINRFKIYPSVDNTIQGESHTVERIGSKSNRVDDVLEVSNGDSVSNIYQGTIYKEDTETPTTVWRRINLIEEKPLLQLVAEERLTYFQNVQVLFSGDVYGQIPNVSIVFINGIEGVFSILRNSYNAQENVTSLVLIQGFSISLNDIFYEFAFDFGNTVKPTIRG
jgi:hypothetical protein